MDNQNTIDMMELLRFFWMKNRSLVTDDMDECMERLKNELPGLKIREYKTGSNVWTWTVPPKWIVRDAWLEEIDGNRVLEYAEHPLSLVSYSEPYDGVVSREELFQHLHSNPERPKAFPYVFKYYQRNWGMCIPHERLEKLDKPFYHVSIDTSFEPGTLKVGEFTIKGRTDDCIVLITNICHPGQVNDSISGCVVAASIADIIKNRQFNHTLKILFLPETIGSICYLSENEDLIPKIKCALFFEMLGGTGEHVLGHSYPGNAKIDDISSYVLKKECTSHREAKFREVAPSDEKVFNGPGIGIPTINITRAPYPYPEYHTSDDNPSIISENSLLESRDLIIEIIKTYDSDYVPKRLFKGPAFLSRYGLWVDWQKNWNLSMAIDLTMLMMDGDKSVFGIYEEIVRDYKIDIDFRDIFEWIERMRNTGLVQRKEPDENLEREENINSVTSDVVSV